MKKAAIYTLTGKGGSLGDLMSQRWVEIGESQALSTGFATVKTIDGVASYKAKIDDRHTALMYRIQTKSVPKEALDDRVDEMCRKIEDNTGRKPGRKERKMIREDALIELLPRAFAKTVNIPMLIRRYPQHDLLFVGSTSQSQLDHVVGDFVRACDGVVVQSWTAQHKITPARFMTDLVLADTEDDEFAVLSDCHLQSQDEDRATVIFQRHNLACADQHIAEGKLPISLSICFRGRLSFRLHDNGFIDKLDVLDIEQHASKYDEAPEAFIADWLIFAEEVGGMVDSLDARLQQAQEI